MVDYIGREYVFFYNFLKLDCEEDVIELGGKFYVLVKFSLNEFEYIELFEVDYDDF